MLKKGRDISVRVWGRLRRPRLCILAYHAIADLRGDPVLAEYAVPPPRFAEHLDALAGAGWEFVGLDQAIGALQGGALPRRGLLLTFDDAYCDLLDVAAPLLAKRNIPAVVFAVAGKLGATNEWDNRKRATTLGLLDADGLRSVAAQGVEVGAHTMTHRPLPAIAPERLDEELTGSANLLEAAGLPRPRSFSYPYGEWTPQIAAATREAGYEVAFTVDWGVVRRGADPHALPRVEVHASDTARKLRLKLALAGWPGPLRDGLLWLGGVRLDPSAS